jgi:cytochrome c peroxidase
MELFFSERLGCSGCHSGFNLSGPVRFEGSVEGPAVFHDTNLGPGQSDPIGGEDRGLAAVTHRRRDVGRFRAPTLRNIAVTAPYMHDGRLATLEEVLDHYERGGAARPVSPYRSPLMRTFSLTTEERAGLLAFLESLTDETFLRDDRFGPPVAAN